MSVHFPFMSVHFRFMSVQFPIFVTASIKFRVAIYAERKTGPC